MWAMLAWLPVVAGAAQQVCAPLASQAYGGPLYDAMAQTDQTLDGSDAIKTAKDNGVLGIALFARVHNSKHMQDGRRLVHKLAEKNPGFILEGAPKLMDMRDDLDSSYIADALSGAANHTYAFLGEILYTHGDKSGGQQTMSGERYIDPGNPGTARLIEGLKGKSVPFMMHWEVYDWNRDWPIFDRLYGAYPDQIFVWPHVGFASAEQASTVLAAHPNVWATLSKKENENENLADEDKEDAIGPPVTDACNVLDPQWKTFMSRFHDRLLFATDAHKPHRWSQYAHVVQRWRQILGQLPPDVAQDIAYRNAAKLYHLPGGAG